MSATLNGTYRVDAFAGRVVVVTGGRSGIGLAVAAAFESLGADVVVAGLPGGDETPPGRAVDLDVTDTDAVAELFASLERLDVLVNCAGIIRRREEYDPAVFARVLDVNLEGTMRCCGAAADLIRGSGGSIVNIASMTSFFGSGHAPAYGASKAAIAQLTKSLAVAYAPRIRVNAVAPGWIETALTGPVMRDESTNRRILERTPFGRWGRPAEVAGSVLFLASEAAAFVTGVVLPVDGGYSVS